MMIRDGGKGRGALLLLLADFVRLERGVVVVDIDQGILPSLLLLCNQTAEVLKSDSTTGLHGVSIKWVRRGWR